MLRVGQGYVVHQIIIILILIVLILYDISRLILSRPEVHLFLESDLDLVELVAVDYGSSAMLLKVDELCSL